VENLIHLYLYIFVMYYINYIYAKYIKFLYDITKDVQIQSVTKASKKLHLAYSDFLININFSIKV